MNRAMQNETLEEIKALSRQVPGIHMIVIEKQTAVVAATFPKSKKKQKLPKIDIADDKVRDMEIFGKPARPMCAIFRFGTGPSSVSCPNPGFPPPS